MRLLMLLVLLLSGSLMAQPVMPFSPSAGGAGGGAGGGTADCQLIGGAGCVMAGQVRGIAGTFSAPGVSVGTALSQGMYAPSGTVVALNGVSGVSFALSGTTTLTLNSQALTNVALYWANLGAVGTPSYSWNQDSDTGFYSGGSNSDVINAATAGVLRLSLGNTAITATVPYVTAAGTVSNPGYSFTGDPNTGVRQAGADILALVAGGMDRFTVRTTTLDTAIPLRGQNAVSSVAAATTTYWQEAVVDNMGSLTPAFAPICLNMSDIGKEYYQLEAIGHGSTAPFAVKCSCVANKRLSGTTIQPIWLVQGVDGSGNPFTAAASNVSGLCAGGF